jgi:hypothetical protein
LFCLLHVRAPVLNAEWAVTFRTWYPKLPGGAARRLLNYLTSDVSRGERGEGQTMADTTALMDRIMAMA